MSNHKNAEDLRLIKLRLVGIANVLGEKAASDQFQKEDLQKLNIKLFSEIAYFLIKPLSKYLQWPPINTKVFITELFKVVNDIKINYPWMKISHFMKSHFQDPRPENDKVVEFLLQLSSLTIYVVTGTRPGDDSLKNLLNIQELYDTLSVKLEQLRAEKLFIEEKSNKLSKLILEKKETLLKEGILGASDDFTLNTLFEKKVLLESDLLTVVKNMQSSESSYNI